MILVPSVDVLQYFFLPYKYQGYTLRQDLSFQRTKHMQLPLT